MSSDSRDSQLPDLRYVRELARIFKQYSLDEIEIETSDNRVLLRRSELTASRQDAPPPPLPARAVQASAPTPELAPQSPPAAPDAAVAEGDFITSPFVGTFYRAPSPDAEPFVEVGGTVQRGQTLCIVEAMKLFNEIEAEFPCVIDECLVESGQAVEYGAKLFRVRKL
jgi:acetyl-CoA carboxylase biotin carboxyl carrier protein